MAHLPKSLGTFALDLIGGQVRFGRRRRLKITGFNASSYPSVGVLEVETQLYVEAQRVDSKQLV